MILPGPYLFDPQLGAVLLLEAVQAECDEEAGDPDVRDDAERVRGNALELVDALRDGDLDRLLGGQSVIEFLGESWLARHPCALARAVSLEATRLRSN